MRRGFLLFTLFIFLFSDTANAWNDKAHAAIAYLAYKKLNRHTKERVDEILVLHPSYKEWTKGAKLGQAGLIAFMHVAMWPDCIQTPACPGYQEDGTDGGMRPPVGQEAWLNLGYSDKLMHKYWHFVQRPYATDGTPAGEMQRPNLETQLPMLTEAIGGTENDAMKSFDLAWIANLVGELHQPLNCITRYSQAHPAGDQNGRQVKVQDEASSKDLHQYWDELLGTENDLAAATKTGKALVLMQDEDVPWDLADLQRWTDASTDLAKKSVYTQLVISADDSGKPVTLDAPYRKAAVDLAFKQAAYAGNRLALLLNKNLR
jgi:hypothetical protein